MIKRVFAVGTAVISLLLAGGICAKADSAEAVLDRDMLGNAFEHAEVTRIAMAKSAGENETVSLGEGVVGFVSGDTFYIAPEIPGDIVYAPENMSEFFYPYRTTMKYMELTYADLSGLNTSHTTNMTSMFEYCTKLTQVDLSGWDTGKVTSFGSMFNSCGITDFSFLAFDFSSATNVWQMFGHCSEQSFTLSNVSFGDNLTSLSNLFVGSQSLETVVFQNVDLGGVYSLSYMFSGCSALHEIKFTNTDCSKITDISGMFSECEQEQFDLSFLDASGITNAYSLFKGCKNMTHSPIKGLQWRNLTNIDEMFSGCSSLTDIDMVPFTDCRLTNMNKTFQNCTQLESVDLSLIKMERLSGWESTFSGCTSLKSVLWNPGDKSNSGGLFGTFRNCTSLTEMDLTSFPLLNTMSYTFEGCSALTSVKFSREVFKVSTYSATFSGCSALEYVDFGGMKLATKFDYLDTFSNCDSLTRICAAPDTFDELIRLKSSTCFPDGVSCHGDEDGDGCCDDCGYLLNSPKLMQGVSLSLGDVVKFNVYADISVCPALLEDGSYFELTLPDRSKQKLYVKDAQADSEAVEGKELYRFSFRLPLCYCKSNQTLYLRGVSGDETRFGENAQYSLSNYYDSILGDKTGRYSSECHDLVEKLSTLGEKAYDYFCNEYKTGSLDTNMMLFNFELSLLPKHSCTDEHYAGFTLLTDLDVILRIYWDEDFKGSVGKRDNLYFVQYRVAPYRYDMPDPISGLCVNDYIIQVVDQYYKLNSRTPEQSSLLNMCMALYYYGVSAKNYYEK